MVQEATFRAEKAIRSNSISFPRLTQSGSFFHDFVDSLNRHLENRNADFFVAIINRRRNETCRTFVRWQVGFVVDQVHRVFAFGVGGHAKRFTKVGVGVRAVDQRGCKVKLFVNGVDDVARIQIAKEDIVVTEFFQVVANNRVILAVQLTVASVVIGSVQQFFAAQWVWVTSDVLVLQESCVVINRSQLTINGWLSTSLLGVFGAKVVAIVAFDLARVTLQLCVAYVSFAAGR